jgi:hypothetical protein
MWFECVHLILISKIAPTISTPVPDICYIMKEIFFDQSKKLLAKGVVIPGAAQMTA